MGGSKENKKKVFLPLSLFRKKASGSDSEGEKTSLDIIKVAAEKCSSKPFFALPAKNNNVNLCRNNNTRIKYNKNTKVTTIKKINIFSNDTLKETCITRETKLKCLKMYYYESPCKREE